MYQLFQVGAVAGSEAFLLVTNQKTALIDSGFAFCAPKMIENIKLILQDRLLDYVLLTHSHYDHASGSAYCRDVCKDVKIVGSEYTKRIFEKPTAKAIIKEMNDNAAKLFEVGQYEDKTNELSVDITVSDGSVIDLGSLKLKTIEASGHTRCSVAFYSKEESLLISCETYGIPVDKEKVMPGYLVGYEISLQAIRKAIELHAENILLPHIGLIQGEQAISFFERSLYWAQYVKDMVINGYQNGKTVERIIKEFKNEFYTPETAKMQPEKAFMLNASYMVPILIKDCT